MNFSDERKQRLVNRLTSEIEQNAHWLRLLNAGAGIEDLPNFNETTINRSSTVDEPEIVRNDVRPYPSNIVVDAVGHQRLDLGHSLRGVLQDYLPLDLFAQLRLQHWVGDHLRL